MPKILKYAIITHLSILIKAIETVNPSIMVPLEGNPMKRHETIKIIPSTLY